MKKIAGCLLVLCLAMGCRQRQAVLTLDEVTAAIKQFDEGWRNKNLQQVDSVLANGYTYFTQSGGLFSRDSVVQTAGSATYQLQSMSRSDFDIQLYDQTAVVSTRWRGKGVYKGVPFNEDQRCSITLIKKEGRVQIAAEHCTPIKQANIFH
ncbi:MAG: hypothetical protein RL172_1249 [Bacteroidota bacterium]|jgi:hypothetical protein